MHIKGKETTFTHLGPDDIPDFNDVTSVSVIPFNQDGNIVAVRLRHRGIDFPGGHVEPGESSPREAMNREVMEEACMTIRRPVLIEVIKSDHFATPTYMLLYAAIVDELRPFVPSAEASERITLGRNEFIEQYEAGNKSLMSAAIGAGWKKLSSVALDKDKQKQ
jgi:8-oxo-dGTP diphosphatase